MTFLLETFRLGLANLMLHKLRSLLTALGIIIGVGAVVAIAAYTEGTKQAALAQFREQGANNIILRSVKPPESNEGANGGEEDLFGAQGMAKDMLDEGIYVIGFSFPVVPKGQARIRVQASSRETTSLPRVWPHRFGASWSSIIAAAKPAPA